MRATAGHARSALRERLEARREEIEAAALARVAAIADPREIADPAYAEGLRRALPAAIGFGIEAIDASEGHDPPIPVDLLAQARLAARNRIPLDTVLRRYFAGHSLLGFYLLEEASRDGLLSGAELQRLTAAQARHFDRLLAAVAEEHGRESESLTRSPCERRQVERIERLLAGEPVDTSEIPYEFYGWHVGVVAAGSGAELAIRELAAAQGCNLLLLCREDEMVWAWLGFRREGEREPIFRGLTSMLPAQLRIGLGEPAAGLTGWRLTHRQARASISVAMRDGPGVTRYADVALLASVLRDDIFADSLRELFLAPLTRDRGRGAVLLETLRAYFRTERNVSSAAAVLGVSRQTVINRLNVIEDLLGSTIGTRAPELEAALRLDEFERGKEVAADAVASLSPAPLQNAKPTTAEHDISTTRPTTAA